VARTLEVPRDVRARLAAAAEATQGLAADVREAVWLVDSGHDTAAALAERMESVAYDALGASPHSVQVSGVDLPLPLTFEFRRHVLLAFREAVHNAARHASASQIDVRITWDAERFAFETVDRGAGFDAKAITGAARQSGRGLRTMRERAMALGGQLHLQSAPGDGTKVRFEAPLAVAQEPGGDPTGGGSTSV
jgi:signal transduction histidine kinase